MADGLGQGQRKAATVGGCAGRVEAEGEYRYAARMTAAGRFIAELQRERRGGDVSSETEQHIKHEFRKLGRDAPALTLVTAVEVEIDRLKETRPLCAGSVMTCLASGSPVRFITVTVFATVGGS